MTPSGPKKQAKQPSKRAKAASIAVPVAPPLPCHQTQQFLMVKIARGSTREDLVRAVTDALMAKDVPLFKDHKNTGPAPAGAGQADPNPCASPSGTLGDGLGPDDAVMIFCKQEGWP